MIILWFALHLLLAVCLAMHDWAWLAWWFLFAFGGELAAYAWECHRGRVP